MHCCWNAQFQQQCVLSDSVHEEQTHSNDNVCHPSREVQAAIYVNNHVISDHACHVFARLREPAIVLLLITRKVYSHALMTSEIYTHSAQNRHSLSSCARTAVAYCRPAHTEQTCTTTSNHHVHGTATRPPAQRVDRAPRARQRQRHQLPPPLCVARRQPLAHCVAGGDGDGDGGGAAAAAEGGSGGGGGVTAVRP
jgi:hypothetical protein